MPFQARSVNNKKKQENTLYYVNRDEQISLSLSFSVYSLSLWAVMGRKLQELAQWQPTQEPWPSHTHTHPSVRPGQEEKHFTENKREEDRERVSKIKGKQAQL